MLKHAILTLFYATSAAWSQSVGNCAQRDVVAYHHKNNLEQEVQVRGLDSRGALLEIWVNHETQTWAAVVTGPTGLSCLAASGHNFERVKAATPGEPL